MPKASPRPKPKTKKPPQKPSDSDAYAAREATKREVGDVADKITRAPKKR